MFRFPSPSHALGRFAIVSSMLVVACSATPGGSETIRSTSTALGDGNDFAAQVVSGTISSAVGSFPSVSRISSEVDVIANNYSLQINSNHFATPLCSPNGVAIPGCEGWEQFIYSPVGTTINGQMQEIGRLYIEYWLLGYGPTCPNGWIGSGNCFQDSPTTTIPAQPIANLANLQLEAEAGVFDTLKMWVPGDENSPYVLPAQVDIGLNQGWTTAEFNVFGNLDGSNAVFSPGSTIVVQLLTNSTTPTTAAPRCIATGYTAETSNLNLVASSCATFGGASPGIRFEETNVPPCVPTQTCETRNADCSTYDDCGNPLHCGTCSSGDKCIDGSCVSAACVPQSQRVACANTCGGDVPDGCGSTIHCPVLTKQPCCAHLGGAWRPTPAPGSCASE